MDITLRDWFAAEAMKSLILSKQANVSITAAELAEQAYELADQMVVARMKAPSADYPTHPKDSAGVYYPNALEISLCVGGKWINAIKEMRTRVGIGLKDAKDAIDKYKHMTQIHPDALMQNPHFH